MLYQPAVFGSGAARAPAAAGVASIAFDTSATSTTASVTGPAGIDAGDILVLFDVATDAGTPTTVVPTGFTAISNLSGADRRIILSYKKANGTEASASLTGLDGSVTDQKILLVFHPNIPATTLTLGDADGQLVSTDPTAQTVTAASGTPPLIVIGAYASGGVVNPRTFTVGGSAAKDGEVNQGSFLDVYLAYKIYNTGPADVVIDMDDEGSSNILMSCYISVT